MAKHFELPEDHLHESAARVEHYLDGEIREKLAGELDRPQCDPHGKEIPPEQIDATS
jgi:manganese/zinc/iron transport system permease protein